MDTDTNPLPKTMRTLLQDHLTSKFTLTTLPVPHPDLFKGEHLLHIHAVGLTRGELLWPQPPALNNIFSPGVESSATVVLAPPTSRFPPGTDVYMRTTYGRSGNLREYATALEGEMALLPNNLSWEEAAAVPVGAKTARQALFVQAGGLRAGMSVLVNGAAGAVGWWVVQLAKAVVGVEVWGVCGTRDVERLEGLGVRVIGYAKGSIKESGVKVDVVIDTAMINSADSWAALKDGGLLLSVVPVEDGEWKWQLERPEGVSEKTRGKFFIMESNGEHLAKITELIKQGQARSQVDSVFKLEEYKKAFERCNGRGTNGRVVIKLDDFAQPQRIASNGVRL